MRKSRSLKRPPPKRLAKRKFIIFTEGKNTEPDYFKAIRHHLFGALLDIKIFEAVGVPMTIAEKACGAALALNGRRKQKSSFEECDQVWAVFDRDEHPRVSEAIHLCNTGNVGVAFSDPCFELWLMLHFGDFDRPDDRHQVQDAFANVCKDYDPDGRKSANFSEIMDKVELAENRAQIQLKRRDEEGVPRRRPFTTVFLLTQEMRKAHNAYRGIQS